MGAAGVGRGEHGESASWPTAMLAAASLPWLCSGLKLFEPFWLARPAPPPSAWSDEAPCSERQGGAAAAAGTGG